MQSGLEVGVKTAILKSKSPSCGIGKVYDGSFTKKLKTGDGILVALKILEILNMDQHLKIIKKFLNGSNHYLAQTIILLMGNG